MLPPDLASPFSQGITRHSVCLTPQLLPGTSSQGEFTSSWTPTEGTDGISHKGFKAGSKDVGNELNGPS